MSDLYNLLIRHQSLLIRLLEKLSTFLKVKVRVYQYKVDGLFWSIRNQLFYGVEKKIDHE